MWVKALRRWPLPALLLLAIGGCGPSCDSHRVSAHPVPVAAGPTATSVPGATSGAAAPKPVATPAGPPATPPARSGAAVAFDGAHDVLILFGGMGAGGRRLNDTWTFDGSRWTQHGLADAPPGAGPGQMAFDGASGSVVLFTGPDQTWTWDGSRWIRQHPVHQPPKSGPLAYNPSLGVVVLLAQSGQAGTHTWGWNGNDWYPINESVPDPGTLAALAYDVRGGRLLGVGDGTWAYIGNRWSRLSDLPPGMTVDGAAMTSSNELNAPVAFAGGGLWAWDGKAWQAKEPADGIAPRQGPALADDEKRQMLVLFGGVGSGGLLGDTWTWTPDKGWNRVSA